MQIDLSREIVSPPTGELYRGESTLRSTPLFRFIRLCRRRSASIRIFFLLGIAGSLFYRFTSPPLYLSSVLVSVTPDGGFSSTGVSSSNGELSPGTASLHNELALATSFSLAQYTLNHNPQLLALSLAAVPRRPFSPDKESSREVSSQRGQASAGDVVSYLRLISSSWVPGTTLLTISATAPDPLIAAKIANAHGQGLIDFIIQQRRESRSAQVDILTRQRNEWLEKYGSAIAKRDELLASLKANGDGGAAAKTSSELESAKQRAESAQGALRSIEEKLQQTSLSADSDLKSIRIVDAAQPQPAPATPGFLIILGSGALSGLALGILFALIRDASDSSINSTDGSPSGFDIPLIASIPAFSAETKSAVMRLASRDSNSKGELSSSSSRTFLPSIGRFGLKGREHRAPVLLAAQFSPEGEALRSMAASLSHLTIKSGLKVILFTSPDSGEGKTSIAVDTAIAFANMHLKTLLIDGNLRHPSIHTFLGLDKDASGLFDYALGAQDIADLCLGSSVENLMVLPSGSPAPLPTLILDHEVITAGIRSIIPQYDAILIDGAGLGDVADSLFLAEVAHAVVFIVRYNFTDHRKALAALDKLRQFDAPLIGTILNGVVG